MENETEEQQINREVLKKYLHGNTIISTQPLTVLINDAIVYAE